MKYLFIFALTTLLLAACGNGKPDEVKEAKQENAEKLDSQRRTEAADTGAALPSKKDMDFLVNTSSQNQLYVSLASLAKIKSTQTSVRRFAAELSKGHQQLETRLQALATARQVTLPTGISNSQQKNVDRLQRATGEGFDRAFVDVAESYHSRLVKDFEDRARNAEDPNIRSFAGASLPNLYAHLDSLRSLKKRYPPLRDTTYVPVIP